ncbi:malate:quinone oxidoreductase [Bacillus sp. CMF21]|nr:malate:quinone oxidoreductase [Bacillus sp. CMF21]
MRSAVAALLGASPGASAAVLLEVFNRCFRHDSMGILLRVTSGQSYKLFQNIYLQQRRRLAETKVFNEKV